MQEFEIRRTRPEDREWVERLTRNHWGGPSVVVHGVTYHPHDLEGFVARSNGEMLGLLTFVIDGSSLEIVSLISVSEGQGVGSALLQAAIAEAGKAGCRRVWVITTNDNLPALGFYQKRGFRIAAVHRGAIERSRRLKPEIPEVGLDGIPMRDELELEHFPDRSEQTPRD